MLSSFSFNQLAQSSTDQRFGLPSLNLFEGENHEPGQLVPVLVNTPNSARVRYYQWGLIPAWAKDQGMGKMRSQAAASNIFVRPSFQLPIRKQRCLIPVDSYILQNGILGGERAYKVSFPTSEVHYIAAIYDRWCAPSGHEVASFALVTVDAPLSLSTIDKQVPLVLSAHQAKAWLNPNTNLTNINNMMQASSHTKLKIEAVLGYPTPQFQTTQAA